MRIAIIGKGRVATHLSGALAKAGHNVVMCGGRKRTEAVPEDVELLILSVKDDAISQVAQEFAHSQTLVVHTSGSVSMDAIPAQRRGVFYPMQTFSLDRPVEFSSVPLFLETSEDRDMELLKHLASTISSSYMPMNGEQRKVMHLAAVLCCNFVNHLFELSHDVLAEQGIPFSTLLPLIDETIAKIHHLPPHEAQTGPALRGDCKVMQGHMELLRAPMHKEIYRLLSHSIGMKFGNKELNDND